VVCPFPVQTGIRPLTNVGLTPSARARFLRSHNRDPSPSMDPGIWLSVKTIERYFCGFTRGQDFIAAGKIHPFGQEAFYAFAAANPSQETATFRWERGIRRSISRRAINSNSQRGSGIIFNELYTGGIVWNKVRMIKNSETGKRLSRPNPREDRQVVAAPHLRIIDENTRARVRELRSEQARLHTNVMRKLHQSKDRVSPRCREAISCGMREELKGRRVIETYARKYSEERQRLAAATSATRTCLESKRARIESERQRNIDMAVKGLIEEDDARQRIADLEVQRGGGRNRNRGVRRGAENHQPPPDGAGVAMPKQLTLWPRALRTTQRQGTTGVRWWRASELSFKA
jgi:hypothetical protein